MSGLCAIYAFKGLVERELLDRMTENLSHRGQVSATYLDDRVGLTATWHHPTDKHRSLLPSEHYCVAADAQLYYCSDLLERLQGQCHPDASPSDLIGAAYSKWQEQCVEYLEGDYAFVLWDARRQRLFCARSCIGLRPFVYHLTPQRFLCASEPSQLFADSTISKTLNNKWLSYWLLFGRGHWRDTVYQEIQVLQPGYMLMVDPLGAKCVPFWKLSHTPMHFHQQETCTEQFRSLLTEAVRTRVVPEDRHCYFDLSGGLDSSSLVSLASRMKTETLHCFHAQSDDSLEYAQSVERKYPQVQLHTLHFREHMHFHGAFDPAPWMPLPCRPTGVLASFYRRQWEIAAQIGAQVHIRGDFGDELLGASLAYLSLLWQERQFFKLAGELRQWSRVSEVAFPSLVEQWLIHPLLQREEHPQVPWLPRQVQQLARERQLQDETYFRKLCPDPFQRELIRWMHLHTDYTIQADVALHMAGLETREPYADMRLIHFLLATPPQYQIRPFQRKFLLHEALKGTLPELVRLRKGKGHAHHYYFQGIKEHRDQLRQVIVSLPEILTTSIDRESLLTTLDHVALGGVPASVPALSGTLALILWAHRLPWAGGILPVIS